MRCARVVEDVGIMVCILGAAIILAYGGCTSQIKVCVTQSDANGFVFEIGFVIMLIGLLFWWGGHEYEFHHE